jgi:hypothetical protein
MIKNCINQNCKKEIPNSATFCLFFGIQRVDKENLSEKKRLCNRLNGDCDDFAILLCSMILSIGGEARINFAYDAVSGHAFAEANIGKTDRCTVERYLTARYGHSEMWHKEDRNGNWWLNLDWQGNIHVQNTGNTVTEFVLILSETKCINYNSLWQE